MSKGVMIPGLKMPSICQKCPCFTMITTPGNQGNYFSEAMVIQMCQVSERSINSSYATVNSNIKWFNTVRPDWCPLVEIEEETRENDSRKEQVS